MYKLGPYLLDHCIVLITLKYPKDTAIAKKVKFHNWKRVSLEPLTEAVEIFSLKYDSYSLSDFVHQFNNGLSAIYNVHSPEKIG